MEDNNQNNTAFDKVKKFVNEHQVELLCGSVGLLCGIFATRFIYERNLKISRESINIDLYELFTENDGNFQQKDGSFPVPQLVKK